MLVQKPLAPHDCCHSQDRGASEEQQSAGCSSTHTGSLNYCHSVRSHREWMGADLRMPRPGGRQRLRCTIACGVALVLWGMRWLWPLQWLPGWVVLIAGAWAVLELAVILLKPQRWR